MKVESEETSTAAGPAQDYPVRSASKQRTNVSPDPLATQQQRLEGNCAIIYVESTETHEFK